MSKRKDKAKETEWQWNKMPSKDYMYFAVNRLGNVIGNWFRGDANVIYPCLKENGDINFILDAISRNEREKYPIDSADFLIGNLLSHIESGILSDLFLGNLGDYVYVLSKRGGQV